VGSKKRVPIVHIGAGLRVDDSFAAGPARKQTDLLADLLYTTDAQASETLEREGVPLERVHCVGNLLMDAMQLAMHALAGSRLHRAGAGPEAFLGDRTGYALVAMNKPVNIGTRQSLIELLSMLRDISRDIALVWPMQSSIESQLKKFRLDTAIDGERITRLAAQPYPHYVSLIRNATCVITDSWNAQEEATALGIPCLTVGAYPERAITASIGSNVAVGKSRALATRAIWECIFNGGKRGRVPELWDGKTAARIASYLSAWLPENIVEKDPWDDDATVIDSAPP
jgi:UDP-N-acetylglucosamine 2-epimerase (non-hydrolysing)